MARRQSTTNQRGLRSSAPRVPVAADITYVLAPSGDERIWNRLEISLQMGLMLVKRWLTPWQARVETRVRDDLVLPYRHDNNAVLQTQPLALSFRAADNIPTQPNTGTKHAKCSLPPVPRPLYSYILR